MSIMIFTVGPVFNMLRYFAAIILFPRIHCSLVYISSLFPGVKCANSACLAEQAYRAHFTLGRAPEI